MTILVTGGAGYIGSHTVVELLSAGTSVQGKIMKKPYVARLPARFDFENISHVVS